MTKKLKVKKTGSRRSDSIRVFKQRVLSDLKNLDTHLVNVKYKFNISQKSSILDLIYDRKFPGYHYVYNGLIAKSINEITGTRYIPYVSDSSLETELEWCILILKKYEKMIQEYLYLKEQYEHYLLDTKFEEALNILEKINEKISYSFWGIEQKLVACELYGGFEENQKTLSKIADETNKYLILLLSKFYSYKAEVDSTYNNFTHSLDRFLEDMTDDFSNIVYKDYIEFQFKLFDDNLNIENLRRILFLSTTLPVIDLYENLVRVCSIVISSNLYSDETKKYIIKNIKQININDSRIENMLIIDNPGELISDRFDIENAKFIESIVEEYTIGNYQKCIELIIENSNQISITFDIIEILIKSSLYVDYDINDFVCNSEFIKKELIIPMYKIYICEEKEENLALLLNSAKILGNITYRYKILNFYATHNNDDIPMHYRIMGEINSKIITPRFIFVYTDTTKKQKYLDLLSKFKKYSQTLLLFSSYVKCDFNDNLLLNIPLIRMNYYRIKANKNNNLKRAIKEMETIIEMITKLDNCNKNNYNNYKMFQYERIATELYGMYIENADIDRAISIVVDSYMLNKSTVLRMNKKNLCDIVEDQDIFARDIKKIVFDYIVDEKDYFSIYTTLANFLELNYLELPSDLITWSETYPMYCEEVNFILYKIYTKEIMKYFVRIDPKKRNEERIMVLNHLIQVDVDNSSKYSEEINNIMKAQSIQERVKSVDEKKIFVDTEAILNQLESIFKEKYRRYVALKELEQSLSFYDVGKLEKWEKFSQAISKEFNESQEKKQRYLMFKELINEIKVEILFNQNYGLNKFLSSRIRHGVLENNLSKTFKNYNLLSLKVDSNANDFIVNKYWDDESAKYTNELSEIYVDKIKKILAEFSKRIIGKIGEVKDWIRISDKNHPNGMFDYSEYFDETTILVLYSATPGNIEFRTFYDSIIDYFWMSTEKILDVIKNRINKELYEYFVRSLDELQHEVEELKIEDVSSELISTLLSKINLCRAVLKSDLNKISNWFVVRRYGEYHNYDLNDLISTCLEINNKTNKKYSLINSSVKINSEIYLRGKTFNYLIDVINILYSNAIQHSGFHKYEDMNICIEIDVVKGSEIANILEAGRSFSIEFIKLFRTSEFPTLSIKVKNELGKDTKIETINKNIIEIFEKIKNPDKYKNMISEEGGTGITKINNILSYNIGSLFFHQYYIDENNWFIADININLENITADREVD